MTLLVRFTYAASGKRYSHDDSHALLAISPDHINTIGVCSVSCRDCILAPGNTKMSETEYRNWILNEIQPTHVHLAVHPDLKLPLSSGMESRALKFVSDIADALAKEGVEVVVSDNVNTPFNPGTWVRFLSEDHQNNYFIERGMLGQVVPDSAHVCLPGHSISIQPLGLSSAFTVPWEQVEPIPEPDESQLQEARKQALYAQR